MEKGCFGSGVITSDREGGKDKGKSDADIPSIDSKQVDKKNGARTVLELSINVPKDYARIRIMEEFQDESSLRAKEEQERSVFFEDRAIFINHKMRKKALRLNTLKPAGRALTTSLRISSFLLIFYLICDHFALDSWTSVVNKVSLRLGGRVLLCRCLGWEGWLLVVFFVYFF